MCKCELDFRYKMRWILSISLFVTLVCGSYSQAISGDIPPHSQPLPTAQEDCREEGYCSDILGFRAISELHHQLDDDQDGHVDIAESDDFLREELQYENGQERQKQFHLNKKHITLSDLWESWKKSEVHNWTVEETTAWLSDSVDLPQYSQTFMDNAVDGATLPRLASSTHFLSNTLGIRDQIHKRKISVKAMDAVLFGPSKNQRSYIKDGVLVAIVCVVSVLCWYYHFQNRHSQNQLHKVMEDLKSLQTAEDGLRQLQEQLDKATAENQNVTSLKDELEKKLHYTSASKKSDDKRLEGDPTRLHQVMEELHSTREQLIFARKQLEAKRWLPPPHLQMWLQFSYELELRNFMAKKSNAEAELITAKEGCEKLRKKKTNFLGSFRLAHGSSIDNVDGRILKAKSSLTELTQELKDRAFRWKKIEELCGFQICKNPGLAELGMALNPILFQHTYGQQNGNGENIGEEGNSYDVSATQWSSGFAELPQAPTRRAPLIHRDSSNYLYDQCLPANTSTQNCMNSSGCISVGPHTLGMDAICSETSSLADSTLESTIAPSVTSSGGINHLAIFSVGESSLDDALEEATVRPVPLNNKALNFQKAKSFSQDPPSSESPDLTNVTKSHSESTLNKVSVPPWPPSRHKNSKIPKQQPLVENKSNDTSPLISDEEIKDKKKKNRQIFKFKRSKHVN